MRPLLDTLDVFCKESIIRWYCIPFNYVNSSPAIANDGAFEILSRRPNAFVNLIASNKNGTNIPNLVSAARLVKRVSRLSPSGYDNFRLGLSFNCLPNFPFFPMSYHSGKTGFSIALEPLSLLNEVVQNNNNLTLENLRLEMLSSLSDYLKKINEFGKNLQNIGSLEYNGIDSSLAPFPEDSETSVSELLVLLGLETFGSFGTVSLTSFLSEIVKKSFEISGAKPVGFNGVMYSLLEDSILADSSVSFDVSIDSLMLYSTVCGCGLDMVPIPGEIYDEELASIYHDIAFISNTLRKPLGARLLPIPGKRENELTTFSHDFLVNSRIRSVKRKSLENYYFDRNSNYLYKR